MQYEIMLSSIGWILAFVGSLFILIGGLIAYIFKQHATENRNMFTENKDDHIRIFHRIEEIGDKK